MKKLENQETNQKKLDQPKNYLEKNEKPFFWGIFTKKEEEKISSDSKIIIETPKKQIIIPQIKKKVNASEWELITDNVKKEIIPNSSKENLFINNKKEITNEKLLIARESTINLDNLGEKIEEINNLFLNCPDDDYKKSLIEENLSARIKNNKKQFIEEYFLPEIFKELESKIIIEEKMGKEKRGKRRRRKNNNNVNKDENKGKDDSIVVNNFKKNL